MIPSSPCTMMARGYLTVIPEVHRCLDGWRERAAEIPDPELRMQALLSIRTKAFHCEGGSAYGLLAGKEHSEAIRFIVAYQTISDYLDNLCDRSTSSDPADFRALHEAMLHALTPGAVRRNYYRSHGEQDDGGYLASLVTTCQEILGTLPAYGAIAPALRELADRYCDLQVYKHITAEERVPRLQAWFEEHRAGMPEMRWFEFSACCGSTLGIFCLVSCAFHDRHSPDLAARVTEAFFPWVQGFHILLDYFIDQEEDRIGGDLNFCSYYQNNEEVVRRLEHFFHQADRSTAGLPHAKFHRMVNRGLLATYLSDRKVEQQEAVHEMARRILRRSGWTARFFYLNGRLYRRIKRMRPWRTVDP
ncbi:MAG: tetraprenyl-beta-curcumene synthase family protein [Deltaproteobacteria bacterium]|nr:tetraprenyl-beta-curcumene synthase family protein [Deltaproteobacteria bacterium]